MGKSKSQYPGLSLSEPKKDPYLVSIFRVWVQVFEANEAIKLVDEFTEDIKRLKQSKSN